jgi:hypothetical protein
MEEALHHPHPPTFSSTLASKTEVGLDRLALKWGGNEGGLQYRGTNMIDT